MKYGPWENIFPCKECDHVLGPSAFFTGSIYYPCQKCGGKIIGPVAGRKVYQEKVVKRKWLFGLWQTQKVIYEFVRWEKR